MNANYRIQLVRELRGLPLLYLVQVFLFVKFKKLQYHLKGK